MSKGKEHVALIFDMAMCQKNDAQKPTVQSLLALWGNVDLAFAKNEEHRKHLGQIPLWLYPFSLTTPPPLSFYFTSHMLPGLGNGGNVAVFNLYVGFPWITTESQKLPFWSILPIIFLSWRYLGHFLCICSLLLYNHTYRKSPNISHLILFFTSVFTFADIRQYPPETLDKDNPVAHVRIYACVRACVTQ